MDFKYRDKLRISDSEAKDFLLKELCDHLFGSDMHYLVKTSRNNTLEALGFWKDEPLHIAVYNDYEVRFRSNNGDGFDYEDELFKSITIFYVKQGYYPTLEHIDGKYYISMMLQKID